MRLYEAQKVCGGDSGDDAGQIFLERGEQRRMSRAAALERNVSSIPWVSLLISRCAAGRCSVKSPQSDASSSGLIRS